MHGYGWRDDDRDDFNTANTSDDPELPDEWEDPGAPPSVPGRDDDRCEIMVRKNPDDEEVRISAKPDALVNLDRMA